MIVLYLLNLGDQVSHKGTLTGGFYDKTKSRLRAQKEKIEKKTQMEELKERVAQHKTIQAKKDGEITRVIGEIQKFEAKLSLDR